MARQIVLYHANCRDGFAAALACWTKRRESIFWPVTYGELPSFEGVQFWDYWQRDDNVMIVDFSFKRDVIERLQKTVGSLIVLDHHKTAEAELRGLHYCVFDMNKSGCRLAWEYLFPHIPLPRLFQICEDRDLWKFEIEETRAVSAGLETLDMEPTTAGFVEWVHNLYDTSDLSKAGTAILKIQAKEVENALRRVRVADMWGYRVPICNATSLWSEIGEAMNNDSRFADSLFSATYYQLPDSRWKWSLRSQGKKDVSELAKGMGGGGHASAAGFTTDTLLF